MTDPVKVEVPAFLMKVVDVAKDPHTHAVIALLLQAVKGQFPQYAGAIDVATGVFASLIVATANTGK